MATSNRDRVNKGMDLLRDGLAVPVSALMQGRLGSNWWEVYRPVGNQATSPSELDVQALLKAMRDNWRDVFDASLGNSGRNLVFELLDQRNKWAHQNAFSVDDTERTLDSIARLLRDGTLVEHDHVQHLVTRSLELSTDQPQPVNLDGEIAATSPVRFSVQRNAVEVVVPAHVSHLRHDTLPRATDARDLPVRKRDPI